LKAKEITSWQKNNLMAKEITSRQKKSLHGKKNNLDLAAKEIRIKVAQNSFLFFREL